MRKMGFNAGYYEWNVVADSEIIYTFGDLSEDMEQVESYLSLTYIVDDLIDIMVSEGVEITEEEEAVLKELMTEQLEAHYIGKHLCA